MKRYFALTIFLIITLMSSVVFGAATTKFEVVEDNTCTINLTDNCTFEKKMINYDLDKRQVTIQLQVTNNEPLNQPTGEVVLLLDNSNSMTETTSTGAVRGDLVYNSAKSLVDKMLTDNDKLKVGVVKFSTSADTSQWGNETADASVVSPLTNDASSLKSAIDNVAKVGGKTDLDAGLSLASKQFSSNATNKYIVVLTDGVPNVALGIPAAQHGGYDDSVINKTKATLESLNSNGYKLITMLTGVSNQDQVPGSSGSPYTYGQIIEKIFGTTENPTAGTFYNITDDQIEDTVSQTIYNDLLPKAQSLTNIKINDYFPQEIVNNFDFAYVSEPTKGTISPSIDEENKIVWSIDKLDSGETATVQYTLTLKDNYDPSIVNKILDTNEKVDITFTDGDGNNQSKTSDETPKVRITEPTTPTNNTPKLTGTDKTTAKTILPNTGLKAIFGLIVVLAAVTLISGIKTYKIGKDIKK